jgi:hypothetical protein
VCCLAAAFPADFPLTCSGGVFWLLDPTNEGTRARHSGTLPGGRDDDGTLKTDLLPITASAHSRYYQLLPFLLLVVVVERKETIGLDIQQHERTRA